MRLAIVLLAVAVTLGCFLTGCKPPAEEDTAPAPIMKTKAPAPTPPPADEAADAPADEAADGQAKCLVCGMAMEPDSDMAVKVECADRKEDCYVCVGACEEKYKADAGKYCPMGEECEGGVCAIDEAADGAADAPADDAADEPADEATDKATEKPDAE